MEKNTRASISFEGGGNLGKILEKLNKSVKEFGVSTKKGSEAAESLNKHTKDSATNFKNMAKGISDTVEGLQLFGRKTKNTTNFFLGSASNAVKLNDALYETNKGISGLGIRFLGLHKQSTFLETALDGPASLFRDISDASGVAGKGLVILSKVAKPLSVALGFVEDKLQKVSNFFKNLEFVLVGLAKTGINLVVKAVDTLGKVFDFLAQKLVQIGVISEKVGNSMRNLSSGLQSGSQAAKEFGDNLDPKKLERVDSAGEKMSKTFNGLSKTFDGLGKKVALGGLIGSSVLAFVNLKQRVEDTKESFEETFTLGNTVLEKTNGRALLVSQKMSLIQSSLKGVATVTGSQLAKTAALTLTKYTALVATLESFKKLVSTLHQAVIQATGLSDVFAQMQALGIDTSAAEMAFQFGIMGEKLLFSAEAAKEFGKQAVTAFAQTEDAAAFVTTLGVGARTQMEGLAAGTESVAAFTSQLANELNNTVTSVQAAEAMYQTLSAGIGVAIDGTSDLASQQKFLESSLKLSSGTGANAAETLNLLSKTTTIYKLSASEAATTASKLNQVVEEGVTTFGELASSLPDVIPQAQSLGIELDEILATVAGYTKVSPSTAEATTGVASLLSAIAGQGAQAKEEIASLGIRFDANSVRAKGLNASLKELMEATGGNQETLKKILPDQLAFRTALALTGAAATSVQGTLQNMGEIADGTNLERVFGAGNQSTIKQFTAIANGFNEVMVDFGRRTLPMLQPGIDILRNILETLQQLPEPLKNVIGTIVIAQTAFSNIGGAVLSVVASIGQLLVSYALMRLAGKALSGQLGVELEVLKQLIFVEKDWAGGISRLLGLNEKLSTSSVQLSRSMNSTKVALEELKKQGESINFEDATIHNFNKALEKLKKKKEELDKSPLKLVDPEGFKREMDSIKAAMKSVNIAISQLKVARVQALKDIKITIDKALSESNLSAKEKINTFKNLVKGMVSPQLVRGDSAMLQKEIEGLFGDTLTNLNLTVEEKVGRIGSTFDQLRAKASPSIRGYLGDVEKEILSGMGRISKQSEKFEKLLTSMNSSILSQMPASVKEAYAEAIQRNKSGLLDLESDLSTRKVALGKIFDETFAAMPDSVRKYRNPLAKEVNKLLDSSRGNIQKRIAEFNVAFANMFKDVPKDIRVQAGSIKVAIQELTKTLEAPLEGRDSISDAVMATALGLRRGVQSIEKASNELPQAVETFGEKLSTTLGKKKQKVLAAFKGILGDEKLSAEIKGNLQELSDDLNNSLRSFINGDILYEDFRRQFERAQEVANRELSKIGDKETADRVRTNLNIISSQINDTAVGLDKKASKISTSGQKAVNGIANSLDGLSGLLYGINPAAASALDGVTRFFYSSRELSEGASEVFSSMSKNTGKLSESQRVITQTTEKFNATLGQTGRIASTTAKEQGKLAGIQQLLNANITLGSKGAKTYSLAAIKAGGASTTLGVLSAKAGAGFAALSGAVGTAGTVIGSFITAAAPFIALGAAVAAAGFVLVRLFQQLIPASSQFADGNRKLAYSLGETNKELSVTIGLVQQYREDVDSFKDEDGAQRTFKDMKESALEAADALGEVDEEIKKLDELEYTQGVIGGIINVLDAMVMTGRNVIKFIIDLPLRITQGINDLLSKIPIIGAPFKFIANQVGKARELIDDFFFGVSEGQRGFVNNVKRTTQDFLAAGVREEVQQTTELLGQLWLEGKKITIAQQQGKMITERGEELIRQAEEQRRALTGSELEETIAAETGAARLQLQANNDVIASLEEKIEKTKDPQSKEALQRELELLQEQTSELERGIQLQTDFLRNQNAIASTIANNQAAQSQEAANDAFQSTVESLKEAQAEGDRTYDIFSNIMGIREEVQENGEIEFISENTVNQASQAGRRAQAAINATMENLSNTIAEIPNPDAKITQDIIAQNLFTAIEAVRKGIEEDPTYAEAGNELIKNMLDTEIDSEFFSGQVKDALTAKQIEELLELQTELINQEVEQRTKAQKRALEQVSTLQQLNRINIVEEAEIAADAQREIDDEQLAGMKRRLQNVIDLKGQESAAAQSVRREIEQFELESELRVVNGRRKIVESNLNLLKQRLDNEVALIRNSNQETLNEMQLIEKAAQFEQKAMGSKQSLTKAIADYEQNALQNKLKLTGDVEERAQIEVELAEQRLEITEREIEFEKQNILFQQELNALAMEREQIELRIRTAETEAQVAENNSRLAQADKLNLTKEEMEALEAQNVSLNQQVDLLRNTGEQLIEFGEKQEVLNQEQLEALDAQSRARRETAEVELELARNREILASYDKQIEKIKLQAKEVEVTNQVRKVGLDTATSIMESQTSILEEQQKLIQKASDLSQQNYSLAASGQRNELRRRRIEEEAARAKLKALETQQKIEYEIFKINELQKELSLEIREIELNAAREQAKANIAIAEAEASKVLADKTSTQEQKEAALLQITAAEASLAANEAQLVGLGRQRENQQRFAGLRDLQFREQQGNDLLQAEFAVAQTTRRSSDDREIADRALLRARQGQEEFEVLGESFLRGLQSSPAATSGFTSPTITNPNRAAVNSFAPAVEPINRIPSAFEGNLNINVSIEGNTDNVDIRQLQEEIRTSTYQGWNEFLDEVRRRGGT
jgi:TP901 family phage tail tape measure protein